jgi:hypothetical protein
MQLHGCARHCRQLCQSLRALKSCVPLAPSQPHSRRMMPEHVCELVWGELGTFVKEAGFGENTPFILGLSSVKFRGLLQRLFTPFACE